METIAASEEAVLASPAQPSSRPLRLSSATTRTPGSSASPNTLGRLAGERSATVASAIARGCHPSCKVHFDDVCGAGIEVK